MFGRAGPRLQGRLVLTAQREGSLSHTEVSTHTDIHIPELHAHHSTECHEFVHIVSTLHFTFNVKLQFLTVTRVPKVAFEDRLAAKT